MQRSWDNAKFGQIMIMIIESSKELGMSLSELQQVLPNYTRSQLQKRLYELRDKDFIRTEGKANKARWYVV